MILPDTNHYIKHYQRHIRTARLNSITLLHGNIRLSIIILITALSMLAVRPSLAQDSYKMQHYYLTTKGKTTPVVSFATGTRIIERLRFTAFFYMTPTFAQSLAGIDVSIFKFLSLGFKAGIQLNNGQLARFSANWAFGLKKIACTGYYEFGGKNDRANGLLYYKYKENNLGMMWQKKNDWNIIGPRLDYKIPRIPVSLWGAAFIALPEKKAAWMYGIYATFGYKKEQIKTTNK